PPGSTVSYSGTVKVNQGLGTETWIVPATAQPFTAGGSNRGSTAADGTALVVENQPNATAASPMITSTYTLDVPGRELGYARALDPVNKVVYTESYTRNASGDVTVATDALKRRTQYQYDAAGDLRTITYPDDSTVHYQYHPTFHYLAKVTDENNHSTQY